MDKNIPRGWEELELKDFLKFTPREVKKPEDKYKALGIRSHCKGTFIREIDNPDKVMMEKLYAVKKNDLIVNITFAWEGAVAIVNQRDEGALVSHRFPTYVFDRNVVIPEYFKYLISSRRFIYNLGVISPGGAGRNRVLDRKDFLRLKFIIPPVAEQKKMARILSTWDRAIETFITLIEAKTKFKKGLMQKMLAGKMRFKRFTNKWNTNEIGDLLDYEQPVKYLVDTILEFNEELTPVLTANKSFILGSTNDRSGIYDDLPVIIFDDFTTNSKYVDFPFKVKSSAIKMLKPKNNHIDLKFVYEVMKNVRFPMGTEHKRYFISEFQYLSIDVPEHEEQVAIGKMSKSIDSEIVFLEKYLSIFINQKAALMQKLLTGKIHVKV